MIYPITEFKIVTSRKTMNYKKTQKQKDNSMRAGK